MLTLATSSSTIYQEVAGSSQQYGQYGFTKSFTWLRLLQFDNIEENSTKLLQKYFFLFIRTIDRSVIQ